MDPTSATKGSSVGTGPTSSRYQGLTPLREPYLVRARRASSLTVVSLFPPMGSNGSTDETLPWTSIGAYGVNVLAAKVVMALYPPGIPFVKLKPGKEPMKQLQELTPDERGIIMAQLDKGLAGISREFMECLEEDGDRAVHFDTSRHLIVGGNHCEAIQKDNTIKSVSLENYVTVRDKSGNLVEFIIEEPLLWETLPDDIKDLCRSHGYEEKDEEGSNLETPVTVYTHGRWKNGKWRVHQECWGQKVPNSEWSYNQDTLPWLFLGMVFQKGEHYARSYCEDLEADLQTLDSFWQMLTEAGQHAARIIPLIKPGGALSKRAYANAANGEAQTGNPDDVTYARVDKQADMAFVGGLADKTEMRLLRAFCANTSIQRQGERVTAEEIRFMAQELESTLGGVYANQIITWQAPYSRLKLAALMKSKRITPLPPKAIKVTILTGDAALGRIQQAQTLDGYIASATNALGQPSAITPYIRISTYLDQAAANKGIDTDGLVKPQEVVDGENQKAMQQQLAATVAPEVVKQGGDLLQNAQQAALQPETEQPA